MNRMTPLVLTLLAVTVLVLQRPAMAESKPLKVFILAGQSNMVGRANVSTFDHIGIYPKTAPMLKEMRNDDGTPRVLDDVYISVAGHTDVSGKQDASPRTGKLSVGFGGGKGGPAIGPEFTFGIYMHKHLKEPILIIKTAWGGKSLNTDFRPPSAGPYELHAQQRQNMTEQQQQELLASNAKVAGHYYRLMIEHVKQTLTNIEQVHPDYDKKAGYELAGFVWFQGFNDIVDKFTYPNRNHPGGYDLYSQLLGHLIDDVRNDLGAPKLPFVIGVMGINGVATPETEAKKQPRYRGIDLGFQKAMAAPASLPQFEGNVAAVHTGKCWDHELVETLDRWRAIQDKLVDEAKAKGLEGRDLGQYVQERKSEHLSEHEQMVLTGASNKPYHYMGSAKITGCIGKEFAEAMIELRKTVE